jgi:hypothetical protein
MHERRGTGALVTADLPVRSSSPRSLSIARSSMPRRWWSPRAFVAILALGCLAAMLAAPGPAAAQSGPIDDLIGDIQAWLRQSTKEGASGPEPPPPDPADKVRASEREFLLDFARHQRDAASTREEAKAEVEREIRVRAADAEASEAEWERRLAGAEERFQQAVEAVDHPDTKLDPARLPDEAPSDRVVRTRAAVEETKGKLEEAHVRTQVTVANLAWKAEVAEGIVGEVFVEPEPTPAELRAAAERRDLVEYARARLEDGEAEEDVVADVQRRLDRRADAARKAVAHWEDEVEQAWDAVGPAAERGEDVTAPGTDPVEGALGMLGIAGASLREARERQALTEKNANTPGLAENIVKEAGGRSAEPDEGPAADEAQTVPEPAAPPADADPKAFLGDLGDLGGWSTDTAPADEQPADKDRRPLVTRPGLVPAGVGQPTDTASSDVVGDVGADVVPEVPGPWRPDIDDWSGQAGQGQQDQQGKQEKWVPVVVDERDEGGAGAGAIGSCRLPVAETGDEQLDAWSRRCFVAHPAPDCFDVRGVDEEPPALDLPDDQFGPKPCDQWPDQPECASDVLGGSKPGDEPVWNDLPGLDLPGDCSRPGECQPDILEPDGLDCLKDLARCPHMMVGTGSGFEVVGHPARPGSPAIPGAPAVPLPGLGGFTRPSFGPAEETCSMAC